MSENKVGDLANKIDGLFDALDSEIKKFLDEILRREQRITEQLKHNKTTSSDVKDELAEIKKTKRTIKKLDMEAVRNAIKEAMELKDEKKS